MPDYSRYISLILIRNVLLAGILLGICITSIRCMEGMEDKSERIDAQLALLINAVRGPASEAAYDIDKVLAEKAVSGIIQHSAVSSVTLIDDFGSVLVTKENEHQEGESFLTSLISGWREEYVLPLSYRGNDVGRLSIKLNNSAIASEFVRESASDAALNLAGFVMLAAFMMAVFHLTLTRPLLEVNRELSEIDPARSEGKRVIPPKHHDKDEIGLLVESINRLFERIELDLERREKIQAELRKAKEAAEEASRTKSEFLANMSHEIRTPLNAILGMTELTLDSGVDEEQRANLEMVLDSGRTLLRVMNDILDVSKVDAGIVEVEKEPLSPVELIDRVLAMFKVEADKKKLKLLGRVGEGVPELVVGDGGRIRQVLFNLLGNAIKFTDEGEVEVSVEKVAEKGDYAALRFAVSDTGIGIKDVRQQKLFESFTQLDGSYSRRYQGAGLGLAIVKRFVDLMGGEIELESEYGRGSVFAFTLNMPMAQAAVEETVDSAENLEPDFSNKRVLLAEDNPVNKLYAVKLLQDLGFDVTAVDDGLQAMDALGKESFDAVVLDVQMPGMDGLAVAEAVRENGHGQHDGIPLVAVTAHAMKGDREKFLAAGMDDYLAKPVDKDELKRVMARVFSKRQ